jgi:archaemetzincin
VVSRRQALLGLGALALGGPARAGVQVFSISVVPLGPVEQSFLDVVAGALSARLKVELEFQPVLPLPEAAWYPPRKRYRAEKLLDALDEQGPKNAWKILGVTHAEISTTKGQVYDWGIAGLGALAGRACVLSTFLYRKHSKTKAALERRLADITVHEFGHTLGLPHCDVAGCVMSDAKGKAIASADASTGHYCESCRRLAQWGPLILKPSPLGAEAGDAGQRSRPLEPRKPEDGGQ